MLWEATWEGEPLVLAFMRYRGGNVLTLRLCMGVLNTVVPGMTGDDDTSRGY